MIRAIIALAAATLALTTQAPADVVYLNDGRVIEGNVLTHDAEVLIVDAKISSIRATISFPAQDVKRAEERPLPEGFFDPPPAPDKLSSDGQFDHDDTLFLEVPVHGAFGQTFVAEGLASALSYARRHRIRHIVFTIDSTGGNPDQAGKAYDLLQRNRRDIDYHAVIRNCTGDAVAIAIACDTYAIVPGASIGGVTDTNIGADSNATADQVAVYRAQLAHEVARDLEQRGRPSDVVRAMIDPAVRTTAWKNENARIQFASHPPADLDEQRIIFRTEPGSTLTLSHDQAVALGIPSFNGDLANLGPLLDLYDFQPESDFGIRAMEQASLRKRDRQASLDAQYKADVEKNIRARDTTERFIERQIRSAAEWDPSPADYQQHANILNLGWGSMYATPSSSWSKDDRREWTRRTDLTIGFLKEALKGIRSMRSLEREADKLGLGPTFKQGELDWMERDIKAKITDRQANRKRRGN